MLAEFNRTQVALIDKYIYVHTYIQEANIKRVKKGATEDRRDPGDLLNFTKGLFELIRIKRTILKGAFLKRNLQ